MSLIHVFLMSLGLVSNVSEHPPPLSQEGEHQGGVVKLTRPDGTPIYVNPVTIAFIRGPLEGEHGHTTIVFSSGAKQTVIETVDDISKIMKVERRDEEIPP